MQVREPYGGVYTTVNTRIKHLRTPREVPKKIRKYSTEFNLR
jgi:hypothetical protein